MLKIKVSLQRTTLPIHSSVQFFILKLTMSCTWVHILSKILDFEHKSLQQDIHLFLFLLFFLIFIIIFLLLLFWFCFLLRSCRPAWALFSCVTLALSTIRCDILQEKCCLMAGNATLCTFNDLVMLHCVYQVLSVQKCVVSTSEFSCL